ncbi:PLP-dependent transferase [Hymenobacter gummosus]|uniref:PLP-dependent transferase n=1 Tax=Hymenobacter gummosus TaxID=1776032 RepID=A0A3S0K4P7_9BACT|nr:PLP-dependent aspartate aminotransferase family protein [Hymenobacter gummosus]RTQ49133.1 PLP-dependent transferase [Hymenobacter gummosus]
MQASTYLLQSIPVDELTGAIAVPIYQTSTFVQEAPGVNKGYDYARSGNPTRRALEDLLAKLEYGHSGYAFASGLAAIDAVVKLLSAGDQIVAIDDLYGGAFRLFEQVYRRFGIDIVYVDTANPAEVAAALTERTKLVWLESPSNPTLKVSDIQAIADVAHAHGALLCVDNTFASPVLQQPIRLGADIVVHSATKYLGGHSDLIAGAVVAATAELGQQLKFIQNASGGILAPFDCFLVIRGLETLALRVERHCSTALKVARYLQTRPEVAAVYYPGLETHPNHAIAKKQQRSGFGGIVALVLKDDTQEAATRVVTSTQYFKLAESLGGAKSLLCHPATMTHKSTPVAQRRAAGVADSLIRLSVGLEDADDLIEDLGRALDALTAAKAETEVELEAEAQLA